VDGIHGRFDKDGMGLESLGLRGNDDPVALGAARLGPQPSLGPGQISGDDDRVLMAQLLLGFPRAFGVEVEDLLDQ